MTLVNNYKRQKGLTLVELVIVVFVVAALAGVSLTVINNDRQRQIAQDSVKRANLAKVVDGIEAYYTVERKYPDDGENANPLTGSDSSLVSTYIRQWPGSSYVYVNDSITNEFAVYTILNADNAKSLKYSSTWNQILECDATKVGVDDCL